MATREAVRIARLVRGYMTPVGRSMKRGIKKALIKNADRIADLASDSLQPLRKSVPVWKTCGCHGAGFWIEKIEVEDDDDFILQVGQLLKVDMERLDLGILLEVGESVSAVLETMTGAGITFDIYDPVVIDTVKARGLNLAKTVSRSMKPDLRRAIVAALDEGEGLPGIRSAIRERVTHLPEWKVDRLARTEANDAINAGANASIMEAPYIPKKEWITIVDDRTSEVCLGLAGVIVNKEDTFPGGYSHPPALPNCRSTVAPVFDKDAPRRDPDAAKEVAAELEIREDESKKRILELV